nr:Tmc487a [Platynereis dumerilii]
MAGERDVEKGARQSGAKSDSMLGQGSVEDSLFDPNTLRSEADVINSLPSKQATFKYPTTGRGKHARFRTAPRTKSADDATEDQIDAQINQEQAESLQLLDVRYMTTSLDSKRKAKGRRLQSEIIDKPAERLRGFEKWKHDRNKEWHKAQRSWRQIGLNFELWRSSFKTIEGHFGTAALSYFVFLKLLFFLNLFIAILLLCVVVFPQQFLKPGKFNDTLTAGGTVFKYERQSLQCSTEYDTRIENDTSQSGVDDKIIDFVQGTGWMERTVLFYGYYFNKTMDMSTLDVSWQNYNMPLAHLLAVFLYFFCSLVVMVRYTATGARSRLLPRSKGYFNYSNKIFAGWDYNLTKDKSAFLKHRNLTREYKNDLTEQRRIERLRGMTCVEKVRVYVLRFLVHIFVLAVLAGCSYLIVYTSRRTAELSNQVNQDKSKARRLLIQYLPSITITALNIIVPQLFRIIVSLEDYTFENEVKITIARTVLLRLASIAVLIVTMQNQILSCEVAEQSCGNCKNFLCWETYVGQQFYKLVILDFVVTVFVTFFVEFPRKLLWKKFPDYKIIAFFGQQEFEIPKNVLDLVYGQTLCWLGAAFCPLIPALSVMKLFLYFYIKKLSLLKNFAPSSRPYRSARSNSYFMTVLLLSFVLCLIPALYTMFRIPPSQGCGPYRIYSRSNYVMFSTLTDTISSWPTVLQQIFMFLTSWMFYLPMTVILCLLIYYYLSISAGERRKVKLLREQLALAGKDKQFLLNQVRQALIRGDFKQD